MSNNRGAKNAIQPHGRGHGIKTQYGDTKYCKKHIQDRTARFNRKEQQQMDQSTQMIVPNP